MRRIITKQETKQQKEERSLRHQEILKKQELEKQESIVRATRLHLGNILYKNGKRLTQSQKQVLKHKLKKTKRN